MTKSVLIQNTPTVQATPDYSDGDVIGGKMTLSNVVDFIGDIASIKSALVYSAVDIGASIPIRVFLFNADPTNSTITENSAFVLHANDLAKLVGVLDLSTRVDLGTPVMLVSNPANPDMPVNCGVGKDLYAVAVAGGTINLGATNDLTFLFGIRRDRE